MKRLSPAAALALAAAFVILFDAVVVMAPHTLAEPDPTPRSSPSAIPASATSALAAAVFTFTLPIETPPPPWASMLDQFATPTLEPTPKPTAKPTPKPTMRDTVWNARTYVKNRVGAKGYNCINAIWTAESKWNPRAGDPNGAYGIPQALPGSRMAAFGSNWRYSPLTQVKWGLWYINSRYGSACAAYTFWAAHAWY